MLRGSREPMSEGQPQLRQDVGFSLQMQELRNTHHDY